jgi:hypothetical protein
VYIYAVFVSLQQQINNDLMTTTILITASILIGFLLIMHYANLFLPKDPVKPGKEAHIYLDGRYNRTATINRIEGDCIYLYGKFPVPLHYRGKFYAVGKMSDGHTLMYLGKRRLYILMRFVELFRKIARTPEYLDNTPVEQEGTEAVSSKEEVEDGM